MNLLLGIGWVGHWFGCLSKSMWVKSSWLKDIVFPLTRGAFWRPNIQTWSSNPIRQFSCFCIQNLSCNLFRRRSNDFCFDTFNFGLLGQFHANSLSGTFWEALASNREKTNNSDWYCFIHGFDICSRILN